MSKSIVKNRISYLFLILLIAIIVIILLIPKSFNTPPEDTLHIVHPESIIASNDILFPNLNTISGDNKYQSFVTAEDYGMKNNKIWLTSIDGSSPVIVAKSDDLKYVSNPIFSPDSQNLAFLRIYPSQIYVYNIRSQKLTNIEPDWERLSRYMNPSLGYGGESYLKWSGNSEIEFENTNTFPPEHYKININTKEITKVGKGNNTSENITDVPYMSQRDDAWGDIQLGACKDETIHSAGCAVSATAMLLKAYGYDTDPQRLNEFLSKNGQGYVEECNIRWYIIPNFAKGLKLTGAYFNEPNFDRLNYQLDHGNPVIIGFNKVPFTSLQHWVVVTNRVGNTYYINDPWALDGKQETLDDFGGAFDHLIVYEKADTN
ncbi:MAG: C39 family peptidase [Candidatus Dojkabacteria bacterium]